MSRVGFIGAGRIGQTIIYSCVKDAFADEIFVYDLSKDAVDNFREELKHAQATKGSKVNIVVVKDVSEIKNCDVIVISAGKPRKPGQSRRDLFADNASIIKGFAAVLPSNNQKAKFVMVANPVDMLASVFMKFSNRYTISSGTQVETMRMRSFIADKLGIPVSLIDGYAGGEHGEAAEIFWDSVTVDGVQFDSAASGKLTRQDVENYMKGIAAQIIAATGGTTWGPATIIADIIKSIVLCSNRVMTVAVPVKVNDETIHVGIPTVIGNHIGPALESTLSENDRKKLDDAKQRVYTAYKEMLDSLSK